VGLFYALPHQAVPHELLCGAGLGRQVGVVGPAAHASVHRLSNHATPGEERLAVQIGWEEAKFAVSYCCLARFAGEKAADCVDIAGGGGAIVLPMPPSSASLIMSFPAGDLQEGHWICRLCQKDQASGESLSSVCVQGGGGGLRGGSMSRLKF